MDPKDLLKATQRLQLPARFVQLKQGRVHRAEQDLPAGTVSAGVGHRRVSRVKLVEGGAELAGVVEHHGLGVVLRRLRRQGRRGRFEGEGKQ